MSDRLRFRVAPDEAGRADLLVARRFPGAGRRRVAALFGAGEVRVDGRVARKGDLVAAGAEVTLAREPADAEALRVRPDPAAAAALEILCVDPRLIAVGKPAGMPSHPLRPGEEGTAAGGIVARFPECAGAGADPREAGLVHRLDAGTSGVLLAARDPAAWRSLRASFTAGTVDKTYLALVRGELADAGRCALPLAQRGGKAVAAPAAADAREACTDWQIVERVGDVALVRCAATTGRMHQVRAHLAASGAPIVGDALYGGPPLPGAPLRGFFLHAESVTVPHPEDGRPLRLEAALPADRRDTLAWLRARR